MVRGTTIVCLGMALVCVACSAVAAHARGAAAAEDDVMVTASPGVLHGNVWVSPELSPVFDQLLVASPTVRRQLQDIQRDRRLHLSLVLVDQCAVRGEHCHALTHFARYNDGTIAKISILRTAEPAEYIGHELEHVREWMEGALRRFADGREKLPETERARLAGERVGRELRLWLRRQT